MFGWWNFFSNEYYPNRHIVSWNNTVTLIFDNDLYDIDIENNFDVMSIIYDINDAITVSGVEFNTNYKIQFSK